MVGGGILLTTGRRYLNFRPLLILWKTLKSRIVIFDNLNITFIKICFISENNKDPSWGSCFVDIIVIYPCFVRLFSLSQHSSLIENHIGNICRGWVPVPSLVVAALGCRSPTVLHISVSLSTNQVEIINFSTQYLPDSNLALMFSLFTTHIYYDRSYDKLFDQNIVKNIVVTFLAQLRVIVITEWFTTQTSHVVT